MAITRAQIPKQLEPGLGRGWGKWERAKFKKIVEKTHGKVYKPVNKKVKVQNPPIKSDIIQ